MLYLLAHLDRGFPGIMLALYWSELFVVLGAVVAISWHRYHEVNGNVAIYRREGLLHVPFALYAAMSAVMLLAIWDFRIYRAPGRWEDWEMAMLVARFLARTAAVVLLVLYDLRVIEMQRRWRRGR